MLKIIRREQPASLTFVLEGRLCHPWTAEAERSWLQLLSMAGNKELWVDLAGVTFIDRAGEELLASIQMTHQHAAHANLCAPLGGSKNAWSMVN